MNYQTHYDNLISRAQSRNINGYVEHHHVIPRCIGGSDESKNIVILTPEEHLVAHEFLAKIYPKNRKIIYAALMMSRNIKNNKQYGWLHRAHAKAVSKFMTGREKSPEHRAHLSAAVSGEKNPHYGKHLPESTRLKISAAAIGRERTPEHQANLTASLRANPSFLGKRHTPETRAKMSAAQTGEKHAMYGRKHTPEAKEKIRLAGIGRKHTPEELAKMSASLKGLQPFLGKKHSPEAIAKMKESATKLWEQRRVDGFTRPGCSEETKSKLRITSKEASDKVSPEVRSARAYKAWETKRAKAANQCTL